MVFQAFSHQEMAKAIVLGVESVGIAFKGVDFTRVSITLIVFRP